jgi:hypothetical protein
MLKICETVARRDCRSAKNKPEVPKLCSMHVSLFLLSFLQRYSVLLYKSLFDLFLNVPYRQSFVQSVSQFHKKRG